MSDLRVSRITTDIVDLPLIRPHQFANHRITHQAYLLVTVHTDSGICGVGEGVSPGGPWWSGESIEGQQQMVERYFGPALVGHDAGDLSGALSTMDLTAHGNSFAKAAVEMALIDALGRALGVPAHFLLGSGAVRSALPVRWALSARGTDDVVEEARQRRAEGHDSFKLKMGSLDVDEDIRRVLSVVEAVGEDVGWSVDPNAAWDFRTAVWALLELESGGIDLIEQPVDRRDHHAMAAIRERLTRARLMADESVCDPRTALEVMQTRACDAISVKVGKSGGLLRAAATSTIAAAAGASSYGGTALETSLGTAASAHLFAALPEPFLGCELVGPLLLASDITVEPVTYRGGHLIVPEGPGLGVDLDPDAVGRHARR